IGSGTIIAVKNSLCSNQFDLVQELSDFEVVLVEVTNLYNSRKILLVCCYRQSNDRGFLKNFEQILSRLNTNDHYTVIFLGDFNYPAIRLIEESGFSNSVSGEDNDFVNVLMDNYIYQLVEVPTRGDKILVLVLTYTPFGVTS
ncbi:Hypothetical predicted protein, partial [Paramuricea clavata]